MPITMLHEILPLARAAGDLLMPYFGRLSVADARQKGGRRRDLVSEADLLAEQQILAAIPGTDDVIAEEGGERLSGAARTWVVDPLDGTINFLHGIPFWCVSIAVLERGEVVAGVVHAPALDLTFAASRGAGCELNGRQIRVSGAPEVGDAIVATGFPYARDTLADNNLDNIPRVGAVAGGLRRMGSAALDLAFTAAGRLDGFWELHLEPWDVAAGVLLVREAGGRVTDFRGNDDTEQLIRARNLVATNGHIHTELSGLLGPLREL